MSNVPSNTLDKRMAEAFDILLQPVTERMSLALFQKKYLPFLTLNPIPQEAVDAMLLNMSSKTGANHTTRDLIGNLLNEWTNDINGTVFAEVEVYDGEGNIVYVVPPLLSNKEELIPRDLDIAQMVEHAGNQARILPEMGENFIRNEIIPLIRKPNMSERYKEMWNRIYKYHDLPLYPTSKNTEEANHTTTDVTGSEIIDDFNDFGD